jgi:ubiquinone/menaquinone biosynthesis C-methylase UbiE
MALRPWLAPLFAELGPLGSSPRLARSMLERAGIGRGDRVLDLACGKGATSVHLAKHLGVRVVGVDACEEFLDAARARAAATGVSERCTWIRGDVRTACRRERDFDATLMLGLFPLRQALALVRKRTRPGGFYLIDDATDSAQDGTLTPQVARALIRARGDELLDEIRQTPSAAKRQNDALYARLARSAKRLGDAHPRLRPALRRFLAEQREANRFLQGALRSTTWLVRRA